MSTTDRSQSRRQVLANTFALGVGMVASSAAQAKPASTSRGSEESREARKGVPAAPQVWAAADLGLRNLLQDGLDDIFARPFELDGLQSDEGLRRRVTDLIAERIESEHRSSCASAIMLPKWRDHAYRRCVQLDPLAAADYLALAILVAEIVEPRRVPVRANRVFSHRFRPQNDNLFNPLYSSASFKTEVLNRLSDERDTWLIQTDIANFYPSIRLERLKVILSTQGVGDHVVESLSAMLCDWREASAGGLPIGPKASHILAEAALIDADATLIERGIDFVRFVDDYRLFAPDAATAERWLGMLAGILEAEGLALNRAKTSISAVRRSDHGPALSGSDWVADAGDDLDQNSSKKKKKGNRSPPKPSLSPTDRLPPTLAMRERLQGIDTKAMLAELRSDDHVEIDKFRLFLEASFCRAEHHVLREIFDILDRAPQCVPYLVRFAADERTNISADVRQAISAGFAERLQAGRLALDYELLYAAKLLGTEGFANPPAVQAYLSSADVDTSPIVLRGLFDALAGRVSESEARSLLALHGERDAWVRRAALRLVAAHLDSEQRHSLQAEEQRDGFWDPFVELAMRREGSSPASTT